jgi:Chemoreceptor zinc-binding domain
MIEADLLQDMTMQEMHPIDKAIAAHARWKSQLRQAIETGKSEWTVERVRPDDVCEFGQWLGERPVPEKMSEAYRTVADLHARFHQEAASVLALALAGHRDRAAAGMAVGSPFASASAKLTSAMVAWKRTLGLE